MSMMIYFFDKKTFNIHGRDASSVHLQYATNRKAFQMKRSDLAVYINLLLS